jgi:hypothetical protein
LAAQQEESKAGLQWIFPFVSKQKTKCWLYKNCKKPFESKVGFS